MNALRGARDWITANYVWVAAAFCASLFVGMFSKTHQLGPSAVIPLYIFGLMVLPYSDRGGRNSIVEVMLAAFLLLYVPVAAAFAVVYWVKLVSYVFTGVIQ